MSLLPLYGMYCPAPIINNITTNATTWQSRLMSAATDKVAFIIPCPKSGTLSSVGFMLGTVTTGDTLKVSFQDVSTTTGLPDGTADQYRTLVVSDSDDDTWKQTGIISSDGTDTGTKRTVTRGDILGIVIEFNSFVAGSLNIKSILSPGAGMNTNGRHYLSQYTSGAWAIRSSESITVALQYSDGSYSFMGSTLPITAVTQITFASNTDPDEIALKFTIPFDCSLCGIWAVGVDLDGDIDIVIYNSTSTALISRSIDKDIRSSPSETGYEFYFSSSLHLTKNSTYYASFKPTSTTSGQITVIDVNNASILDQMAGGQTWHYSQRVDAGAWTATTTRRPLYGLILDGIYESAGGGAKVNTGLDGGMNS